MGTDAARFVVRAGWVNSRQLEQLKGRPLSTSEGGFLREVQGKSD